MITILHTTLHTLLYSIHTLYFFIASDFKTIVIPSTIFGLANSFAAQPYNLPPPLTPAPTRALKALTWTLLTLIPFAISNQLSPSAIAEDTLNKPWRPLPQNRLTRTQAKTTMLTFYALSQIHALLTRTGHRQSLAMIPLGTYYNHFGGADHHPLTRNLTNAAGYLCFTTGAMEVALGCPLPLTHLPPRLAAWLLLLAAVVSSTVHLQDLYDQDGDRLRARRTLPLVIGDSAARWAAALPMLLWGVVCPAFWRVDPRLTIFGGVDDGDSKYDPTCYHWNFTIITWHYVWKRRLP
ncbi:hypothetical protein P168DRAFT_277593 [Aspergillus campestris IBT 28561]|uniref:UbiA prenyltransferase n=1 Tax=Aspergillus campestris (strain IBT 28561) TaxID=1392248 RepID=A0A2I1DDI9_ASPC2|nr:uncharacterized protein P168DRAFT_277593 [Aspergillus campestris IBT 28561]PKY07949.1 hypothetical protein P168DRAFT_277593 [Aspergillus campestris IBT 28561]